MVSAIDQIPFRRLPAMEALHLDIDRYAVDDDYTGYGHSRLDALTLAGPGGSVTVRDALVLALHCADPGEALADDIELEFVLDEPCAPGRSVSAPLSRFLAVWLPPLRGDERAVVLALCNPHRAALRRPEALGSSTPLYYATGDVESWYDDVGGVRLVADAWRLAR